MGSQTLRGPENELIGFAVDEVDGACADVHMSVLHRFDLVQERVDILAVGENPIQLAEITEKLQMIN